MARSAAAKPSARVDESELTKGQVRKLNALRKSVGDEIGNRAFVDWISNQPKDAPAPTDKTAEQIADAIMDLVKRTGLSIPRGGYTVRRGRGRVIVEPAGDG